MSDFKPGDVVKVRGFQGVACYFVGHPFEVFQVEGYDDQGEPFGTWERFRGRRSERALDMLETRDVENMAIVRMVGDDAYHTVAIEDLSPCPDYCAECGQIGCGWCPANGEE